MVIKNGSLMVNIEEAVKCKMTKLNNLILITVSFYAIPKQHFYYIINILWLKKGMDIYNHVIVSAQLW